MKLRGLVPMLETADLRESIKYYTDILGFECQGVYPESGEPCWASLTKDKIVIMLTIRNTKSNIENPTMTGTLYLYPDNVDQAWEELKDKAEVSYEIEDFEYGMREFGIIDPNGYLLQFGQDVEEVKEYERK
ncbi:MAG: bleomycin resistance family protein [Pyrinomonadaceae bacterium]|nr:bleomycin resistance family protein [Pyrinomonadaceae bacterium]